MKNDSSVKNAKDDTLERYRFAEEVAKNIMYSFPNGHDAFSIGIKGPWGCGKSSIMNFLKSEIPTHARAQNINYAIVDFNPWFYTGQEDLLKGFLIQLAKELRSWKDENNKISKDFESIGKLIEKLADAVPMSPYKFLAKGAAGIIGNVAKSLSQYKSLEELKQRVDERLEDSSKRLYIFIDDVDRLVPSEIAQVLKLVKLNLNFKNTIFFIAYDGLVVEEALRREYGQFGNRYLEKIIQVEYGVPEILGEKIEEIFFKELDKFIDDANIKYSSSSLVESWSHGGLSHYFRTLRDVYRFTNSIRLSLPAIHQEVFITDFILLEAIRIFDYKCYKYLQKNYLEVKKDVSSVQLPSKRQNTREILQFIFRLKNPFEQYSTESNKRFSEDNYFERYFSLRISKRDISEADLNIFLNEDNNRNDLLKRTFKEGRYLNLLRRLTNPLLKEHYKINNESYFESLLEFWDSEEFELSKIQEKLWYALRNIAESFPDPAEGIERFILNLISNRSKMSYSRLIFLDRLLYIVDDNFAHELNNVKDLVLKNEVGISNALKYLIEHFAHWFEQGFEHSKNDLYSQIFVKRFSQFFPDQYKTLLGKSLESNDKAMFFARYHLMIDSTSREPFRFDFRNSKQILPEKTFLDFASAIRKINTKFLKETNPDNSKYLKFYEDHKLDFDLAGKQIIINNENK